MVKNNRIQTLAELTKGYHTVLDIGTDHGLVLLEAFKKNFIQTAIASDIREKPLNQARRNLEGYPVSFVLSDGFLQINQPFDLAIISGMGARLIRKILTHAPKDKTFVLQANDKHEELRRFLNDHHFEIIDERVIFDQFYYVIIIVKYGKMDLTETDLYLGPILRTKPEAKSYYEFKRRQYETILPKVSGTRKKQIEKIINFFKQETNTST
ncbi:MAG: class I SAM-dependent methyltransferase [Acholeplasmataceae bacterium]|nr:class I SAM-dependent methyltransferase [Acholeplasmataceae bacterium]